jgi:hypothetical protein
MTWQQLTRCQINAACRRHLGFREPQNGVLLPKVLRHLVRTAIAPTMILGTASNGAKVKSRTLEMNVLLVAGPVSIPLERLIAGGVIARNFYCHMDWRNLQELCSGGVHVIMKGSIGKTSFIPHSGPVGLILHERGLMSLHRVRELVTKIPRIGVLGILYWKQ